MRSLRSVYGDEVAFGIVPRTFKLPDEMDDWEGASDWEDDSEDDSDLEEEEDEEEEEEIAQA